MTIAKFKEWMQQSTIDEKRELAEKAETALSLLYQLSYEKRHASSGLAGRIEKAAEVIGRRKRHAPLPVLTKADLSEDCAKCWYFKECNG